MTSVWDFVLDFRPVSHPCVFSISGDAILTVLSFLSPFEHAWAVPVGAMASSKVLPKELKWPPADTINSLRGKEKDHEIIYAHGNDTCMFKRRQKRQYIPVNSCILLLFLSHE